jgi:hypothetical protein
MTYTPYILKQRGDGLWVIQQANRTTGTIRQFGPYTSEVEARHMLELLTGRVLRPTTAAK